METNAESLYIKKAISVLYFVVASLFISTPAVAAIVTVTFTGTVNHVGRGISGNFSLNDPISGSYTFDTNGLVQDFGGGFVVYSAESLNYTVGTYSGGDNTLLHPRDAIGVNNTATFDQYLIETSSPTGPQVAGLDPTKFRFQLYDPTATALSDSSLPTSFVLSDWDTSSAGLSFIALTFGTETGINNQVRGLVTGVTSSVVPLPAAFWLFTSGIIGLTAMARRRL